MIKSTLVQGSGNKPLSETILTQIYDAIWRHPKSPKKYCQCSSTTFNGAMPCQWRHNEGNGLSNHRRLDCLPNRLFRRRSKKASKLRVTGLCKGNPPVTVDSPHKGPVTLKMFLLDDVITAIGKSDLRQSFTAREILTNACLILRSALSMLTSTGNTMTELWSQYIRKQHSNSENMGLYKILYAFSMSILISLALLSVGSIDKSALVWVMAIRHYLRQYSVITLTYIRYMGLLFRIKRCLCMVATILKKSRFFYSGLKKCWIMTKSWKNEPS